MHRTREPALRMSMGSSEKTPRCLSDGAVNYSTSAPALLGVKAIFTEMSRDSGPPENSVGVGRPGIKTH